MTAGNVMKLFCSILTTLWTVKLVAQSDLFQLRDNPSGASYAFSL